MPQIPEQDNGDGSYQNQTEWQLPDSEFIQLAPPTRRVWGVFPAIYQDISGKAAPPHHDVNGAAIRLIVDVLRTGFMIIVAAAVLIVLICCFPAIISLF